jgi:hypothetical protein
MAVPASEAQQRTADACCGLGAASTSEVNAEVELFGYTNSDGPSEKRDAVEALVTLALSLENSGASENSSFFKQVRRKAVFKYST